MMFGVDRRKFLGWSGIATCSLLAPVTGFAASLGGGRRRCVLVGAPGGASFLDSFMAIRDTGHSRYSRINAWHPSLMSLPVSRYPFTSVECWAVAGGHTTYNLSAQTSLVTRFGREMVVATQQARSLEHVEAQQQVLRGSVTGPSFMDEVGRTSSTPFGHIHLLEKKGGFQLASDDTSSAGLNLLLTPSEIAALKDDPEISALGRALYDPRLSMRHRGEALARAGDLERIAKAFLLFWEEVPSGADPAEAAFAELGNRLLPDWANHPLMQQALVASMMIRYDLASALTLSPVVWGVERPHVGPEIRSAFDGSHRAHRATQAVLWSEISSVLLGLRVLLETCTTARGSLAAETLLLVASEFGRSDVRPRGAAEWSSYHAADSAVLAIAPFLRGGRLLGDHPRRQARMGWDPATGSALPGVVNTTTHVADSVLGALGMGPRYARAFI